MDSYLMKRSGLCKLRKWSRWFSFFGSKTRIGSASMASRSISLSCVRCVAQWRAKYPRSGTPEQWLRTTFLPPLKSSRCIKHICVIWLWLRLSSIENGVGIGFSVRDASIYFLKEICVNWIHLWSLGVGVYWYISSDRNWEEVPPGISVSDTRLEQTSKRSNGSPLVIVWAVVKSLATSLSMA